MERHSAFAPRYGSGAAVTVDPSGTARRIVNESTGAIAATAKRAKRFETSVRRRRRARRRRRRPPSPSSTARRRARTPTRSARASRRNTRPPARGARRTRSRSRCRSIGGRGARYAWRTGTSMLREKCYPVAAGEFAIRVMPNVKASRALFVVRLGPRTQRSTWTESDAMSTTIFLKRCIISVARITMVALVS